MLDLKESTINNFFCCTGLRDYMLARFALLPVLSPSANYANSVFEGMSIVERDGRPGLFHPALNFERMRHGIRFLEQKWMGHSDAEMCGAVFAIAALNGWHERIELKEENPETLKAGKKVRRIYVRPLAFINKNLIGFSRGAEYELLLGAVPMGAYLPQKGREGICVMLFPMARELPFAQIKAASNYQLAIYSEKKLEYYNRVNNEKCSEVVFANSKGVLTEGGGENIMLIRGDELVTPPPSEGALPGITLRLVASIAEGMGMKFRFGAFTAKDLDGADALFFTGNAAGVVPIGSVVEVDSGYRKNEVHELREGADNDYMKKIKWEYEKLESFQDGDGFHTFMDDWMGEKEMERLFGEGEKFREAAEKTYGEGYCSCIPFNPKPKWKAPAGFRRDSARMLREFGIKKYLC
ncbi:MAG: aminotransferase class IV [Candidatus Micrarchaeota archaeon]